LLWRWETAAARSPSSPRFKSFRAVFRIPICHLTLTIFLLPPSVFFSFFSACKTLQPHDECYLGYSAYNGTCTDFDTVALPQVPPAYRHLAGLVGLFKSKLGSDATDTHISITTRFTYSLHRWEAWQPPAALAAQPTEDKLNMFKDPPRLNVGTLADPVR
jgi:hypothetical protein